jgi:Tfp pilus assembly protein PilN
MKAVNLLPPDGRSRRAYKGTAVKAVAPRRPLGAYVVLGALAIAVLMAGGAALTGRQLSSSRAELASTQATAAAAEAKVASLAPYTTFASVRQNRVETLTGLIDGRVDWSHALHEVARVVPANVDLISLVGTTSPTSSVEGASGGSLRSALPVPAVDLIGCAKSQTGVALLISRLRAIDGVQRVSLESSEKAHLAKLSATECRATSETPQFQITVFFKALEGLTPAVAATAAPGPAAPVAGASPAAPAAPAATTGGAG